MLSRPLSAPSRLLSRRESMTAARGTHAFAGWGPDEVSELARESMAPSYTEETRKVCVDTIGETPPLRRR
jgi:hypothetical protein